LLQREFHQALAEDLKIIAASLFDRCTFSGATGVLENARKESVSHEKLITYIFSYPSKINQ